MGRPTTLRASGVATLAAAALSLTMFAGVPTTSVAGGVASDCFVPQTNQGAAAKGGRALDHEEMSAADVARVEQQTNELLAKK